MGGVGYIGTVSNKGRGIHNEDAKSRKEHDGKMTLQKKSKALNVMRQQAVTWTPCCAVLMEMKSLQTL